MSPSFTVAEMTALDIPEVFALEQQLFPHDAWPESFFYAEFAHSAANLGDEATRRYWIARTPSGDLAGYAGMMCVLPIADVQTLAVAEQAQGQGLGTQLLRLLIEVATQRRAEQVLLEVRVDNPGAQALYRREGFVPIHTRPHYYPDGQDALIMQKQLTTPDSSSSATDLRSPLT